MTMTIDLVRDEVMAIDRALHPDHAMLALDDVTVVVLAARQAKCHHPWRGGRSISGPVVYVADANEVLSIGPPDRDAETGQLTARGRAIKAVYDAAFRAAPTGQGGGPCERCGKPVEPGRYNVCLACSADGNE
jgi:hypothetical protein